MGASGPSGGFDIHNFFNKSPPSSYPQQYASQPPYPPNQFSQNPGSFSANSGPLPSMPPQNFQYGTPQQLGQPPVFHPYMHYQLEHGLLSTSYTSAQFNQQQQSPQQQYSSSSSFNSLLSNPTLASPALSSSAQTSPPLDGARLMALLTTNIGAEASSSDDSTFLSGAQQSVDGQYPSYQAISQDVPVHPLALAPALLTASPALDSQASSTSVRPSSDKQPRGRPLWGDHVVYDVDVRKPGEAQPQLEVSPITVYGSDPLLVLGRQIAVNKRYICYGLRQGTIRILNINTALRALLRGHTQRVTDMVFLSEDQHLLASASVDGRIYVRRILEGPCSEGGKIHITEQMLLAIHMVGNWESCHPRVCWNLQMKDVLEVAIGKVVLSINVLKLQQAAPQGGFLADQPLKCQVDKPLEGVRVVGAHNGNVTDLAVPSFSSFKVASASEDGTMRIWGDSNQNPLSSILPHVGEAVAAVAFLSAPRRPDAHVLLTAGPLNRELKLWAPTSGLVESSSKPGSGTWRCLQTLEFQSSDAPDGNVENAIFNQLVVAPRASLILLANAKRNAIYAVHVEFGQYPAAARMDYLAEFSVTMPILSFTVTEEAVTETGEGKVQIYCVQTQAIQQYGLDVSQCSPPVDRAVSESLESPESLGLSVALDPGQSTVGHSDSIDGWPNSGALNLGTTSPNRNVTAKVSAVSPAFGSPVEVGRLDVLTANHVETSIPIDFSTYMQSPEELQNSVQLLSHLSSISEVVSSAGNREPASFRRTRSMSPTRNPLAHHISAGSKKIDDTFAISPASPTLMPPLHVLNLDRSHSAIAAAEEHPERQDKDLSADSGSTQPYNFAQDGSHQALHLITPSELMNLAAGSMQSEAFSTPLLISGQEERIKHTKGLVSKSSGEGDGFIATDSSVVIEKEAVKVKSLAEDDSIGKEDLVSTLLELPEAIREGKDYTSRERLVSQEINVITGYLADRYVGGIKHIEEGEVSADNCRPFNVKDEVIDQLQDISIRDGSGDLPLPPTQAAIVKGRKNKNKTSRSVVGSGSVLSSQSANLSTCGLKSEGETSNAVNSMSSSMSSAEITPAPAPASALAPTDPAVLAQVASMQELLNQLVTTQKEMQKQITIMVAVPVAKEGKRMEGALGQRMEKVLKAHVDSMWARLADENARRELQERERVQQVSMLLTNFVSKDMPVALERGFKKEFAAIGPVVAQAVLPPLHKAVSTTVAESFQGFTEKMLPQLEKLVGAKLEGTVTRQIQIQFQTIGRQVLQEAMRSCFESSLLPAFERTCRSMFDHVESSFQHGMAEYTQHAQEQLLSSHSDLASTLKDTVASATILADSLKCELADGQKKLLTLAENASAIAARTVPVHKQTNCGLPDKVLSLQHLEESLDPTIELSRLLKEGKLEDAFNKALSLSDVAVVSWLCMQIDETHLFSTVPLPLSQGVLLSLVQQLGCDLGKDTPRKLSWIREAALALNPDDPLLAPHMRPFLQQLYENLRRQVKHAVPGEQANLRLVIHVVHSLLTSCK